MQNSVLVETYLEYKIELLRFLSKRLGSPALAADLVHDLYVKLRSTPDIPSVQNHRAYLFRMAANLATDHVRGESRRAEIRDREVGVIWRNADNLTPERHVIDRAELAYLKEEIAKLPSRHRRVFFLSRFEGKTQAEIAESLGVGITTVHKDIKKVMTVLLAAHRRFHGLSADVRPSVKKEHGFE